MDKVPYYEPAYTEETHYSHVCRLAKLNGFDSIKAFSNQYLRFGNEDKRTIIRNSAGNMAPFFTSTDIPEDYSDYILNTTAYSYQAMFMDDYRRLRIINRLYQIDTRLSYSGTMDKKKPCFCMDCMRAQKIFKRLHQIPSVKYCPIHKKPLLEYIGTAGHEFELLSNSKVLDHTLDANSEIHIATFIQDILYETPDISVVDVRNIIRQRIEEFGGKETFAKSFHQSQLSGYFDDEDSIMRFINANLGQSKISESKAISILVFLFDTCTEFIDYYNANKAKFGSNDIDEKEFCTFLDDEGYTLVSDFRQNLVTILHRDCGNRFLSTPKAMLNGWACPHCSKNMSDYDFQARIVNYAGAGNYTLIQPAKNMNGNMVLHHNRCNKDISKKYADFLFRGYRCPCESRIAKSDAEKSVANKGNFELITFNGSAKPATIKCKACGNTIDYLQFKDIPKNIHCRYCNPIPATANKEHIQTKRVTPLVQPKPQKQPITKEIITQNILALVGNAYEILNIGHNNKNGRIELTLKHNFCGCECKILYKNFTNGSRCSCEGFGIQATNDEIKRYISELSGGYYICIDTKINRKKVNIKNIITNEIVSLPYSLIIQELKRPTESVLLPCNTKQTGIALPRSAPMLFMEYLTSTYGNDGVFFKRDISYAATDHWISSTINMFLQQGLINRIGMEIYTFPNIEPDWNKIVKLFYIGQNGIRHGCTYGRSFLAELGISVKYPAKRLHILSNRETRLTSIKSNGKKSIREIGNISLNVKPAPCNITNQNYKILQLADYMSGYNNQNYPQLSETDNKILVNYVANVPRDIIKKTLSYYPESVRVKVMALLN